MKEREINYIINKYKEINLKLEVGFSQRHPTMPTAKVSKIVTKAIYPKPLFFYRYKNESQMIESLIEDCIIRVRQIKAKTESKESLRRAKISLVNPYRVGDIFYNSWGYDQTNIDFYQVTEVGKKSVKIRPISQRMTESAGFMCEYVEPIPNDFTGEEKTKMLSVYKSYLAGKDTDYTVYMKAKYGTYNKYDGKPKYQSHYA